MQIYIATPVYDRPCVDYNVSTLRAVIALEKAGHHVAQHVLPGCCYVHTARNKLVVHALKAGADRVLFWDADIGCEPEDILKLVNRDYPIVGALAPFRFGVPGFGGMWALDADGHPLGHDGLVLASVLPTALMLIKREVFVALRQAGKAPLTIENEMDGSERDRYLSWFDFERDGVHEYGEDVTFNRKYQAIGGQLYIEPDITLRHHSGDSHREGNLHQYLTMPKPALSAVA